MLGFLQRRLSGLESFALPQKGHAPTIPDDGDKSSDEGTDVGVQDLAAEEASLLAEELDSYGAVVSGDRGIHNWNDLRGGERPAGARSYEVLTPSKFSFAIVIGVIPSSARSASRREFSLAASTSSLSH